MKIIKTFSDLEPYGIKPLTGEACRVGRRVLCDLDDRGRKIVADMLGVIDRSFNKYTMWHPAWNGGESSASFMMPYGMFNDLAVWCLLDAGCNDVRIVEAGSAQGVIWDGGIYGIEDAEEAAEFDIIFDGEFSKAIGRTFARVSLKDHPGRGTRCEHAMSG